MNGFDLAVLVIMLVSLLLGLWRGLVYEVLSLLGWPIAFVLSKLYAANVAPMIPVHQETMRIILAYLAVFVVTLIVWGVLAWLLSRLMKAVGLGWLDRILGGLFGFIRACLVILVMVWLAGLTVIPEQPLWQSARTSKAAEDVALITKAWLPDSISRRIRYGTRS
jgi:membrane protein required for colicin V production